jgi:hypothetical protein
MATKKHSDAKMDEKVAKKVATKAVKAHETKMHAKGGGIKIRGTGAATKGTKAYGPMA